MNYAGVARALAEEMGILGEGDKLVDLGSLALMDYIVALEDATNLSIAQEEMTAQNFTAISSVSALLSRLAGSKT